jgi:hypothetical protein
MINWDFVCGILVGAFGLLVIAVHYANKAKAKPEAKPQASAIGMDISGNGNRNTLGGELMIFRQPDAEA